MKKVVVFLWVIFIASCVCFSNDAKAAANAITQQPSDVTALDYDLYGCDIVSFSVNASINATSFRWQVSKDNGNTWKNISLTKYPSAREKKLTFIPQLYMDGYKYRCTVTFKDGAILISDVATLTVRTADCILFGPSSETVEEGGVVKFYVYAIGSIEGYQWQVSKDHGNTWTNVNASKYPSALTDTLSFSATLSMNGYCYRCKVTFTSGETHVSPTDYDVLAELTVYPRSEIITQPVDKTVCLNEVAKFSVSCSRGVSHYCWQVSTDHGETWSNLSQTDYPSSDSKTLSFYVRQESMNGYMYRCIVKFKAGAKLISNPATLTIEKASITKDSSDLSIQAGATAAFSIKTFGTVRTYTWQVSKDGGATWKNVNTDKYPSAKKKELQFTTSESLNGYMYRCFVYFIDGTEEYSNAATLTIAEPGEIILHPEDTTVSVGAYAYFTVNVKGAVSRYRWEVSKDDGVTWKNVSMTSYPSAGTNQLEFAVKLTMNGYYYRCTVSFTDGSIRRSRAAKLRILEEASFTCQPEGIEVHEEEAAWFSVEISGNVASYQWQVSTDNGAAWSNISASTNPSAATDILNFRADLTQDGYLYRCEVTFTAGTVLYSDAAKLSVIGIISHPTDRTVLATVPVRFSVVAGGDVAKYQWQVSENEGATWADIDTTANESAAASTLRFESELIMDGNLYRCAVTYTNGEVLYTNAAMLTVE